VEDFTRAAAQEFAERGINVNNVGPGPMDTPFFYGQETRRARRVPQVTGDGQPADQTSTTSRRSSCSWPTKGHWITGQTIFANGGYTRVSTARLMRECHLRHGISLNACHRWPFAENLQRDVLVLPRRAGASARLRQLAARVAPG